MPRHNRGMLGTYDLALFVLSGLLLNAVPGPDTLLVVTRSAAHGWRLGSAAALGIGAGVLVHVAAAAMGLSALLAASPAALSAVQWLGAAYLVYLGLQMLRTRSQAQGLPSTAIVAGEMPVGLTWRQVFWQGWLTNVLNPKVLLFFLAFVPQFIAADAPSTALAFLFLGLVFNVNSMLWLHALAWGAWVAGQRLRVPSVWVVGLQRALGGVFMGWGLWLALGTR